MFKNYFKVAIRKMWKGKVTSAISILGLASGMACCMLITLFIKDELSYNSFNTNKNNIYGLNWKTKQADGTSFSEATSPLPYAPVAVPKISGIQTYARLFQRSGEMQAGNMAGIKRFQEQQVYFADSTLFSIFTMPFVAGTNNTTALSAPNSVVLTDEMAAKYFGSAANAMGKTLLFENKQPLLVTGVVKKMPANSDVQFDFLVSLETLFKVENESTADFIKTNWTFTATYTYLLLKPGQGITSIERQLNDALKKYGNARNREMNAIFLQPLANIHLYAADVQNNLSASSITYIYIFAAIALLILFIANVNFINLAVAQSVLRTREVGMRKVLGAGKAQLVAQFLGETLFVSFISFILAVLLACLGLPLLNELTNKQLSWLLFLRIDNVLLFAAIFIVTSIGAGLYPAFFISRFKPAMSVKGKAGERVQRNTVRKALLVTQFAISTCLIVGAIIMYQQLQYMRNKPLGFQKSQVVVVPLFGSNAPAISNGVDAAIRQKMNTFSEELVRNSKINAVTSASALPGQNIVAGLVIPQGFADNSNIFISWISVDYNFLDAMKIPVIAGRGFSRATGTDHLSAFIINESALHTFNWKSPQDAIGKTIIRGEASNGKRGQIIGVIKDFNLTSLDQPMQPLILDVNAPRFREFAVNVQASSMPATIGYIKSMWDKFFPERVFEYSFLDKDIDRLYADKENLAKIIECFALAAIVLSCSGLFSIASFLSIQRTKEIGIRKVLGASVTGILVLLCREFVKLVLVAFVIALPLIWYVMHSWLQNFAYRINMPVWVFVIAGTFVLLMAVLTVGFQSIKAALTKPVTSLRAE